MHHHHVGHDNNAGDRRDVADEIEVELVIECRVERVEGTDYEQGVAVCRRAHDRLGCDVAAGSRTVVDDERLTEPLREPLTYQACRDVRTASGREANNDAHRPRRIGLRPSYARNSRERGSARGQIQKISAGKFHLNLPSHHSITSSAMASRDGGTSRPSALAVFKFMTRLSLVGC